MRRASFVYSDMSGMRMLREVSNAQISSAVGFTAFCHVRNAERFFLFESISDPIDLETGNRNYDIRSFTGSLFTESDWVLFNRACNNLRSAVAALKTFAASIRKFSDRERNCVIGFLRECSNFTAFSNEQIYEWLGYVPYCGLAELKDDGDRNAYDKALSEIPSSAVQAANRAALCIAKGSGRKPISASMISRIDADFK